MALLQARQCKGIVANYWAITDLHYKKDIGRTYVELTVYVSKEARDLGLNNGLDKEVFMFEGFKTIDQCYNEITESKVQTVMVTPPQYSEEPGTPEDPTPIRTEIAPAVYEERETNLFANAPLV